MGALEQIRKLQGGHLHAIVYVIKYTTSFNSAFLKSIDTYLSNLAPICSKVIVVHSGYDPVAAIKAGNTYLDMSERIKSLNSLLAGKPYFNQLDMTHLAMNNDLSQVEWEPAQAAFCYQQRDRLLDLIANAAQQPTKAIDTLLVSKPPILSQLTTVIKALTESKLDGLKAQMLNVELSPAAQTAMRANEELGQLKAGIRVHKDDLAKIDNKDLISFGSKKETHPYYFFMPTQRRTITFQNTVHPIRHFEKTHDDRCWEVKEEYKCEQRMATFTCQAYFCRGLTMNATVKTWSCDYHADKIRKLRDALHAEETKAAAKEGLINGLALQVDKEKKMLEQYQRDIKHTTTVTEYLLRPTVPLDLLLKISSSRGDEPAVLNRLVMQVHEGQTPDTGDLEKLFQAYMDHFAMIDKDA
ncbi:hypothetical protein GGF31_004242 [Allomyces arbusculus]|nr:hypothetical protein GGF31_004242 [Allomyces arbusculus]